VKKNIYQNECYLRTCNLEGNLTSHGFTKAIAGHTDVGTIVGLTHLDDGQITVGGQDVATLVRINLLRKQKCIKEVTEKGSSPSQ